jgi:hypothetical protein
MSTTVDRDKAKRGIKARQDAIATLIANHQAEFDEMHAKNRIALGLSPRSSGPTRQQLEERIQKQREKLEKWEAELRLAAG